MQWCGWAQWMTKKGMAYVTYIFYYTLLDKKNAAMDDKKGDGL